MVFCGDIFRKLKQKENVMYCTKCGKELKENALRCEFCKKVVKSNYVTNGS